MIDICSLNIVPLSNKECIQIDGGEEGDTRRAIARFIGKAVASIENAWDDLCELVDDMSKESQKYDWQAIWIE